MECLLEGNWDKNSAMNSASGVGSVTGKTGLRDSERENDFRR
jgi:hypothetical protein